MSAEHYTVNSGAHPSGTRIGILIAARIATEYANRLPTAKQLQARFGMSRATAFRWISAFKLARGLA